MAVAPATLHLSLTSLSGDTDDVEASSYDTLRSLGMRVGVPDHAGPVFIANGQFLQPDLSLASQHVIDGAQIHIIFQRRAHVRHVPTGTSSYYELLRLADVSFHPFEMVRSPWRMARLFRPANADAETGPPNGIVATKVVVAEDICEEPLPSAWSDADPNIRQPRPLQ
jgi:hypothetical protein